jgi:hypothetical protein
MFHRVCNVALKWLLYYSMRWFRLDYVHLPLEFLCKYIPAALSYALKYIANTCGKARLGWWKRRKSGVMRPLFPDFGEICEILKLTNDDISSALYTSVIAEQNFKLCQQHLLHIEQRACIYIYVYIYKVLSMFGHCAGSGSFLLFSTPSKLSSGSKNKHGYAGRFHV